MSVNIERLDDKKTIVMSIQGRFDFSLHTLFRDAYKDEELNDCVFIVDLMATEYIDSSALAMLVLLKEHAETMGSTVLIKNQNQGILNVLNTANFDKLFKIE
ncbi:MAG: STAS domain-containing protein [Gammaproteobacteria bacterium]|nr:STAS domain-containing protein [Gammaproteobacteria bacterium]